MHHGSKPPSWLHPYGGSAEPEDLTHPVSAVPVGRSMLTKMRSMKTPWTASTAALSSQSSCTQQGAVLAALAARPARETDGHVRVRCSSWTFHEVTS
ncbi:hypothetical protein INR49_008830 [Caranx melampygus]|nr:hypothetical protein INR49_008830 [Caranx melampygus]